MAVNLSPLQFANPGLVRTVAAALAESGLEPARLELEITESVLLHDSAVNIAVLDELSDLGVSIALDDFGTGYSSLSYLHRFSFDRIKIDHSFVRDITRNEGSLKIVRAIVMLAHSLGLKVTAEGVETDEQLAAVRGEGCDAVQGFYTGAPTPRRRLPRAVGNSRRAAGLGRLSCRKTPRTFATPMVTMYHFAVTGRRTKNVGPGGPFWEKTMRATDHRFAAVRRLPSVRRGRARGEPHLGQEARGSCRRGQGRGREEGAVGAVRRLVRDCRMASRREDVRGIRRKAMSSIAR